MYNPLKQFYAQQSGPGKKDGDKDGTAKKEKKQEKDHLNAFEKQVKEIKASVAAAAAAAANSVAQKPQDKVAEVNSGTASPDMNGN